MFERKKKSAPVLLHEGEDFAEAFRTEPDPKTRRLLLEEYGDEKAELRRQLLSHRYSRVKGQEVDNFLRAYLMLRTLDARSSHMQKAEAQEALTAFCLDQVDTFGEDVLFDELYNAFWRYYCLCDNDRTYNAVAFGLGQINENARAQKVAKEIRTAVFDTPKRLGLSDAFALLQDAAEAAFQDHYPGAVTD
ncbi:MAG TPA: hypothetical protein DGX96_04165 [Lachnospiraceae bacterium]|jgi:hypothetical protein|nr:hypothetical protein [Lachnospiraceae bacterium]